jgi:hypothetical protein
VRGFRTCFSELAILLVLLTTLLLLAGLLLPTLLLLAGLLLATLLLATLLLLARLLVWILVHRIFLLHIGSPLRSLVFHGKSQSADNAFVPMFTLKQCVWNLSACFEFPCK